MIFFGLVAVFITPHFAILEKEKYLIRNGIAVVGVVNNVTESINSHSAGYSVHHVVNYEFLDLGQKRIKGIGSPSRNLVGIGGNILVVYLERSPKNNIMYLESRFEPSDVSSGI